jgi:hypothetical protein
VDDEPALGWIDDGRLDQSLAPCVPQQREWLEAFRKPYRDFYQPVRAYRPAPAPERPEQ